MDICRLNMYLAKNYATCSSDLQVIIQKIQSLSDFDKCVGLWGLKQLTYDRHLDKEQIFTETFLSQLMAQMAGQTFNAPVLNQYIELITAFTTVL